MPRLTPDTLASYTDALVWALRTSRARTITYTRDPRRFSRTAPSRRDVDNHLESKHIPLADTH